MSDTFSDKQVEIATMWCEVIHAINEADKINMEVGEFISSVLEPQFEIRRKPLSEDKRKVVVFWDEEKITFYNPTDEQAVYLLLVPKFKTENENLKKQLREQIAGAAMNEQSLLELNRKIGENIIYFAVWLELEGYRIKGMDDTQRQVIYDQFLQSLPK